MKARPILMNADMVRAILREIQNPGSGKSQTRRIVKDGRWWKSEENETDEHGRIVYIGEMWIDEYANPYGQPGDLLWVRETFAMDSPHIWYKADCDDGPASDVCEYADTSYFEGTWKPSIHMPRWASLLTLKITDVRVERLQDIGEEDARAEGIIDAGCLTCGESEPCGCADPRPDARDAFILLWNNIYDASDWQANPWVWVIEFEAHRMNVDKFIAAMEEAA